MVKIATSHEMKKGTTLLLCSASAAIIVFDKQINSDIWHLRYCTVTVSQHVDGQGLTPPSRSHGVSWSIQIPNKIFT